MKLIKTGLVVAGALALVVAVPVPSQAASSLTIKFCTYSAQTPVREYSTSWKVRATSLWSCDADGEASAGYKRVTSRLQEWDAYFGAWVDVASSTSGVTKWGTPETEIARLTCSKQTFRTATQPSETESSGKEIRKFQTVYSASKKVTTCS